MTKIDHNTFKAKHARRRPGPLAQCHDPEPLFENREDIVDFREALDFQMRRHGEGPLSLCRAISTPVDRLSWYTIRSWRRGQREPQDATSFDYLARIEVRYRLPSGYFRSKLSHPSRATARPWSLEVSRAEHRRIAWHLPDDFDHRSSTERQEILGWVRRSILSGTTEFRQFQSRAVRDRFGLQFRCDESKNLARTDIPSSSARCRSPAMPRSLEEEIAALVSFKTAVLTESGYQRSGIWRPETAAQKIEHLGLLFGALAAAPDAGVAGRGVDRRALCLAMLVFPAVWDWYVRWRQQRRGFFTGWEADMMRLAIALTRKDSGWIRQTPTLGSRLVEIPGLISSEEIQSAGRNWNTACDRMFVHACTRAKEIQRIARVHRNPFEPILPILESASPVGAYRAITEEVLRRMPDERQFPRPAAEAVRGYLMLRLGLHLGVRQRNLRELRVRRRGDQPTPEAALEVHRCGELRWSEKDDAWEVFIPALAFKNSRSSYFSRMPYRLVLPRLGRLYEFIDSYITKHRAILLNGATDPRTFFVKTVKRTSKSAAYDQNTFYEAWRLVIERYGIYNPYTGRGAISGLLPHGPHSVRDVLATHVLKHTGSYEQAGYAIQDTAKTVADHYGRFLPHDKAALAARVLNEAWATP